MLVCILLDIKNAVFVSMYVSICPGTDISAEVRPIHMKVVSSGQFLFPFGGDIFIGHQMQGQKRERGSIFEPLESLLTVNISKKRKLEHYMSIRA